MRKQKTPALVNLAIYTTITVFLWIFFDVYRSLKKPPDLNIDQKLLAPLNPTLNSDTLKQVSDGIYFENSTQTILPTPTTETTNQQSSQTTPPVSTTSAESNITPTP